jgi:polar amino acid transport system substrate-binding protein
MSFRKFTFMGIALILLVATVITGCQPQASANKIVVATDATWPPMEFVNEQREIVGYDIDLMKAVAEHGGFEIEFRNVAWDGIFAGLAAGEYDAVISSVTITDERRADYDFSTPYINAGQIVVVRTGSDITGPDTLSGRTVGAQIGTTGAFAIQDMEGVTLREYDEVGLAFEDLLAGRIDAVVCDTPVAADFALQREEYKAQLQIVGESFTEEYYGILVQKGNTELLEKINKGLDAVQKAGIDQQIADTWLR